MIDEAILSGLKRVNVSKDKEKTQERVESLWKPLTASEKKSFLKEVGEHENNIHRIRKTGVITPKLALIIASHFNCDPSFLSADTDENSGWSDGAMRGFLESKGYSSLVAEAAPKQKRPYNRRKKAEVTAEEVQAKTPAETAAESAIEVEAPARAAETEAPALTEEADSIPESAYKHILSVEDMVKLLYALSIRAPYNADAKDQFDQIERILLS